jgi:chromosome partitioning protein
LGINLPEEGLGLYDLLMGEATLEQVIYPTEIETLKLIPSSVDLTGAEIELVGLENREQRLKNVLQGAEDAYEFILIDCPPSLGLLTLNALGFCQSVLIPMQCEYYALQGLSHLLKTLKLVKRSLNPDLRVEGILLTMFDGRTLLAGQVRDQVKKYFKEFLVETIIPRNIRLSEAPSHGKPVVLYASRSRGADSYIELAKEIISRSRNGALEPASIVGHTV